jgi:hypothetical protein
LIKEIFGQEKRNELFCDIDQGATEVMEGDIDSSANTKANSLTDMISPDRILELDTIMSAFDKEDNSKKPQVFMLHNRGPRYQKVQLNGSMDEWKIKHDMSFDSFTNQWFITIHLKIGQEYLYKYVIDDKHWVVNDEEPQRKDTAGNINNYCGFFDYERN